MTRKEVALTHREFFYTDQDAVQATYGVNEVAQLIQDCGNLSQVWVYLKQDQRNKTIRLMREPQSKLETIILLSKLEALKALPFFYFEICAFAKERYDLVGRIQEYDMGQSESFIHLQIEYIITSVRDYWNTYAPVIFCWDMVSKLPVDLTEKRFKYSAETAHGKAQIYAIKNFPGLNVK